MARRDYLYQMPCCPTCRRRMTLQSAISVTLRAGPMTYRELASRIGAPETSVQQAAKSMSEHGQIRAAGFVRPEGRTGALAKWELA